MKHTLEPYVTTKGGVVILNGPFALDKAEEIRRLCKAAPEMLEALRELVTAADYVLDHGGDILTSASWYKARAVLAKAKGE